MVEIKQFNQFIVLYHKKEEHNFFCFLMEKVKAKENIVYSSN